jgi:hypothetical protein
MAELFTIRFLDGLLGLELPPELDFSRERLAPYAAPGPADWQLQIKCGERLMIREEEMADFDYPLIDGVRRIRGRAFDLDPTPEGARVLLRMYHAACVSWVLRPWTAMLLLPPRGLLFHAAGLVSPEGRGYLCPGVSGAGKSTLAGNLHRQGWAVLTDELAAVRRDADGWKVLHTPFTGDLGPVATEIFSAPLETVLLLDQGPPDLGPPLDFAATTLALSATVAVYGNQPWFSQLFLDLTAALREEVGVRRLRIPADLTPGTVEGLLAAVDDKG